MLLQAHAHTLQRLAALLGEDVVIEILELAGERNAEVSGAGLATKAPIKPGKLRTAEASYGEIEHAVNQIKLSPMLEFYLWSYQPYRELIESSIELNAVIDTDGGAINEFVEHSVASAHAWVRSLHLPPDIAKQTEAAASVPWTRFRMHVLTSAGRRPFASV